MVRAFEDEISKKMVIPEHPELMGAIGAALVAAQVKLNTKTRFKGFETGIGSERL
jgi:activator of 2-hydroxyglutaryl-CoA dehydratase